MFRRRRSSRSRRGRTVAAARSGFDALLHTEFSALPLLPLDPATPLRVAAQNTRTADAYASALERLSTGLRINRAADGPADLAMGVEFERRHRSTDIQQRNVGAATDMVQVAEGGMKEIQDNVVRMQQLAMQAANGTYTDEQRELIDQEFQELSASVSQVAESTTYNQWKLLYQDKIDVVFVVDTSGSMSAELLAASASLSSFQADLEAAGYDVEFGLVSVLASNDPGDATELIQDIGTGDVAAALAALPTPVGAIDPYAALLNGSGLVDTPGTKEPDAVNWREGADKVMIYMSDTGRETALVPQGETETAAILAAAGVKVHVIGNGTTQGVLDEVVTATNGSSSALNGGAGVAGALASISDDVGASAPDPVQQPGDISLLVGLDGDDTLDPGLPRDMSSSALGLHTLSVDTVDNARTAIDTIPGIIDDISAARAEMGAILNRLERISNVAATRDLQEQQAQGRIVDADVATETARLASTKVRMEQGAAIAGQLAEVQRTFVLTLLSGG